MLNPALLCREELADTWKALTSRTVQQLDSLAVQSSNAQSEVLGVTYWVEQQLLQEVLLHLSDGTVCGLKAVRSLLELGEALAGKALKNPVFNEKEQLYLLQQREDLHSSLANCIRLLEQRK